MTNAATVQMIQNALNAGKIVMINRFQFEGAKHADSFFVGKDGCAYRRSGKSVVCLNFANIAVYVRKTA